MTRAGPPLLSAGTAPQGKGRVRIELSGSARVGPAQLPSARRPQRIRPPCLGQRRRVAKGCCGLFARACWRSACNSCSTTRELLGDYELDFRILHNGDIRWISARGRGDVTQRAWPVQFSAHRGLQFACMPAALGSLLHCPADLRPFTPDHTLRRPFASTAPRDAAARPASEAVGQDGQAQVIRRASVT